MGKDLLLKFKITVHYIIYLFKIIFTDIDKIKEE
jgi:hypothetical protein